MVDAIFKFLSLFKHLILNINWPSLDRIPNVETPILFIKGEKDEIVPPDHTERLYEAASKSIYKKIYKIPEGHHNDAW